MSIVSNPKPQAAFWKWSKTAQFATVFLVVGVMAFVVMSYLSNGASLKNVSSNNSITQPTVSDLTDTIELGQIITMRIDGFKAYNDKNKKSPSDLILYINENLLKLHPSAFPSENIVSFYLERTEATKEAWLTVLRPQAGQNPLHVPINVSAGYENEAPFLTDYKFDFIHSGCEGKRICQAIE